LPGIISGLPGSQDVTYQPTVPQLVVEIHVDSALEFGRYRHRPVVVRLREDQGPDTLPIIH
jgi:ATP-dependent DNA ligase